MFHVIDLKDVHILLAFLFFLPTILPGKIRISTWTKSDPRTARVARTKFEHVTLSYFVLFLCDSQEPLQWIFCQDPRFRVLHKKWSRNAESTFHLQRSATLRIWAGLHLLWSNLWTGWRGGTVTLGLDRAWGTLEVFSRDHVRRDHSRFVFSLGYVPPKNGCIFQFFTFIIFIFWLSPWTILFFFCIESLCCSPEGDAAARSGAGGSSTLHVSVFSLVVPNFSHLSHLYPGISEDI